MLLLLLLACAGGPDGGPGGDESGQEGPQTDPRALVEVAQVVRGDVGQHLIANGVVESETQADLVPEATGTVVAIRAEEGDRVRRGQVLAVIENASLDAVLARAQAEAARADAELAKIQDLHAKGAVSDRDLREARHAAQTAETSLAEARSSQGHTRLVSPIDGTVAVRNLQYGEVAGGQPAFTVVDLSKLRVVVQVPERDLSVLAQGMPATLRSVYDEETSVPGHIERIAPTVDPTSGTVRVTVALDDPEGVLRPGQYVGVRIETAVHSDVITVPRRSIFYEEGDPVVFRVAIEEPPEPEVEDTPEQDPQGDDKPKKGFSLDFGDGGPNGEEGDEGPSEPELPGPYRIARKVPVELGFVNDDWAEIVSGVDVDDSVVIVGQDNLRDEARVRLPEDPRLEDVEPEDPDAQDGEDAGADDASDEGSQGG